MNVALTVVINEYRARLDDGRQVSGPHQRFTIGNIYIMPSYNPREAIDMQENYFRDHDTLVFRDMHYLFRGRMPISQRVIAQSNFILPGELYKMENVDLTYRHLLALRQYRLVNIRFSPRGAVSDSLPATALPEGILPGIDNGATGFTVSTRMVTEFEKIPEYEEIPEPEEIPESEGVPVYEKVPEVTAPGADAGGIGAAASGSRSFHQGSLLDVWIQLTPFNMQSYTIELEGTNSSGDFGFGGNLMYQHRNALGNAEILDFKVKGSVETLNESYTRSYKNTYEYGVEARLQFPRFLLPIRSISFVRRYNPRTNLSLAYSYQQRPDYTRTIANAAFGYSWKGSEYVTHLLIRQNLITSGCLSPHRCSIQ
jgi:hypothetical protein